MLLTLEIISANGEPMGANRRKIVGPEGAQIGRARESDWVISDPYISRAHARIRFMGNAFYVEGTGRNALAINDPNNVVPNNDLRLLRNGDRFFLDQYEIRATVEDAAAAAEMQDDAYAPAALTSPGRSNVPRALSDMDIHGTPEESNLDPLAALGLAATVKTQQLVAPVNLQHGSVLDDGYRPPVPQGPTMPPAPPAAAPTHLSGGDHKIPDGWERSRLTILEMPREPVSAHPPTRPIPPSAPPVDRQPAVSDAGGIPDEWEKARMTRIEQAQAREQLRMAQRMRSTMVTESPATSVQQPGPAGIAHRSETTTPQRPGASAVAASDVACTAGSLSLEELLRAAGVPQTQMSPELAQELGQVLRIVVQGVMDVLQSRTEIKSQLRMNMTRMQPAENNPLKFSPNVEAALHTLLVERNRGYLTTARAFQEALDDIRNHQIAVMQGIRKAFNSMLENFDPERLEQDLERHGKRSLLNVGAKTRFREAYAEKFQELMRDPDASFRRLFGEYFAEAYEEQIARMKMTPRPPGR